MTTSAADPAALRTYAARAGGSRSDIARATTVLTDRLAEMSAALPSGHTVPAAPDVTAYLGRVGAIDEHVVAVSAAFEQADVSDDGGRRVVDDAALAAIPFVSPYSEAARLALVARAEDELATLHERLRSGHVDDTTAGELVATLAVLRHVIDTAPDRHAQAAGLIDAMGPGDLHMALQMLRDAAHDNGHTTLDAWSLTGITDLSHVVSLGLEGQPRRAGRWADDLMRRRDTYHDADAADAVVLLSAFTAAGTSTFGASLFNRLNRLGQTSDGGLPERVLDTRSPVVPLMRDATANPHLANAIVESVLADHDSTSIPGHQTPAFTQVFSVLGAQDPRYQDLTPDDLTTLLSASVDRGLDTSTRVATSVRLAEFVVNGIDGARPVYGYDGQILQALGASLQPGLEVTVGRTGVLLAGGDRRAQPLYDAAAYLSTSDGGARGIGQAVDGLIDTRVHDAARSADEVGTPGQPVHLDVLDDITVVIDKLVTATSGRQFQEVVNAIEADGWGPASEALIAGSFELTPAPVLGDVIAAAQAYHGQDVDDGGPVLSPDFEGRAALSLLDVTLAGRPDLATPHVLIAFERAAEQSGLAGIHGLLDTPGRLLEQLDGDDAQTPSAELAELARLYDEQRQHLDVSTAALLSRVTGGS